MRKAVSILIVFCVLAAVPVFEVSGASIAISKLSKKTAGPFDVIKICGAGFTPAADRLGTVEPGKLADLVVLDKDPLLDIGNLRTARIVVQGGKIVKS